MDRNRMDNGNDDGVIIPVAATALEFGSDYETFYYSFERTSSGFSCKDYAASKY